MVEGLVKSKLLQLKEIVLKVLPALCKVNKACTAAPGAPILHVLDCLSLHQGHVPADQPFTSQAPALSTTSAAQSLSSAVHTIAIFSRVRFCCLQQAAGAQAAPRLGAVQHGSAEVSRRRHAAP